MSPQTRLVDEYEGGNDDDSEEEKEEEDKDAAADSEEREAPRSLPAAGHVNKIVRKRHTYTPDS